MENQEQTALETKTFDGGVSEANIKEWKAKHRKVFRVDIVDGDETHIVYFKRPDFSTVKTTTKIAKTDEVESGRVMFEHCFLGGSKYVREDMVLFMAAQVQLNKLLNSCMGSLKNL